MIIWMWGPMERLDLNDYKTSFLGNQEDRVLLIMAGNRQNGKIFGGIVMHIVLIHRAWVSKGTNMQT